MSDACRFFHIYMADFRRRLSGAVDEHKWYMSERANRDVGYPAAYADFLETHFDELARDARVNFCRTRCEGGASCRMAAFVDSIPSTTETFRTHVAVVRERTPRVG